MKRIMLSILFAFLIILLYLILASAFVVATDHKLIAGSYIDFPLRLPKVIFYFFSPPNQGDFSLEFSPRRITVLLISLFGNLFIYSIPFYFILGLFTQEKEFGNENPPPPPPPPPPFSKYD